MGSHLGQVLEVVAQQVEPLVHVEAVLEERLQLVVVQGTGDGPLLSLVGEPSQRQRHLLHGGERPVGAGAEHHGAVVSPPGRDLHGVAVQAVTVIDRHGGRLWC